MNGLRTKAMKEKYARYRAKGGLDHGCKLCEKKPLIAFKYWKITENKFPWDKIAKIHQMVLPKRHVTEPDLSKAELKEFARIKKTYLHKNYEFIFEATNRVKTIPTHFHLHLMITK